MSCRGTTGCPKMFVTTLTFNILDTISHIMVMYGINKIAKLFSIQLVKIKKISLCIEKLLATRVVTNILGHPVDGRKNHKTSTMQPLFPYFTFMHLCRLEIN